ncbi:MAG: hypothetical protein B7Y95_12275, partial [Rhizobiales bacterium 32-66-11]
MRSLRAHSALSWVPFVPSGAHGFLLPRRLARHPGLPSGGGGGCGRRRNAGGSLRRKRGGP